MRISDWSSDVCSSDLFAGDQKIRAADVEIIATAAGEVFRRPAGAFRIGFELEAHAPQAFEKRAIVGARDLGQKLMLDLHKCQRHRAGDQDRKSTRLNSSH